MSVREAIVLVDPVASGEPFRDAARALGYSVIAVVTVPEGLARQMSTGDLGEGCDLLVQGSNPVQIERAIYCRGYRPRAVLPATEPGVNLAEELSLRWKLPGNTAWPGVRRDKSLMRERARIAGLPVPRFARCYTPADVLAFARERGGPVVVKTPSGAGGVQVFVCRSPEATTAAFHACIESPNVFGERARYVLAEEFLVGKEFAVNLFVDRSTPTITDIFEYEKVETDTGNPVYLSMIHCDSAASGDVAAVGNCAVEACRGLGLVIGPAHVEIMLTSAGPMLVEVGARLCGARVPEMWRRFSTFDPFTSTLRAYLDEPPGIPAPLSFSRFLAVAFLPYLGEEAGTLEWLDGVTETHQLPSFVEWISHAEPGRYIERTRDLENNLGMVHLANTDRNQLVQDVAAVHRLVKPCLRQTGGLRKCAH